MEEFETIVITFDDGEEVEFCVLEETQLMGKHYYLVVPCDELDNDEESEGYVLRENPDAQDEEFGMYEFVEDEDAIVNEINAATVDVILSVMPSPKQEHFLSNNRGKMSVILWYGVGNCKFAKRKYSLLRSIQKRIRIYKLENHIRKYEKQGEE